MGPELLFGEGFIYAAVGWSFDGLSILDPSATDVFIEATVLPAAFVGDLPVPFTPPHLGGRMIVAQSEVDLILWGGALVRGDDDLFPEYRSYEYAGMPHIPANSLFEGAPQLDWRPFVRALLVVGHDWAANGVEPPPSVAIDSSAPGEIDPVYGWPTGIARDETGNALGGVRPPDLELGRGHFVAADFDAPLPPPAGFIGAFIDLACTDAFRATFPGHGRYMSAHKHAVDALVHEGFLLRRDASEIHVRAARSPVAKPGSCR